MVHQLQLHVMRGKWHFVGVDRGVVRTGWRMTPKFGIAFWMHVLHCGLISKHYGYPAPAVSCFDSNLEQTTHHDNEQII